MKKALAKSMLFETIKVEDGEVFNLEWHNKRFNKGRTELFKTSSTLDLIEYITPPQIGLYRCKIIYNKEVQSVEYFPYEAKNLQSFKVVNSQIDYTYKYTDRSILQELAQKNYDEIIIEKDGFLTDTSIANIAFYDGKDWLTPTTPLLEGTTRARLIDEGFLKLSNIKKENIKNYSYFSLMNAMIGFRIQKSVAIQI
ncbi:MAG: Aminodeoxychorismate lyase (EC [uncultured Sulfurovum sp.]|uniref:Aminodeoxychorismate lyase (EC) n=1 Tax=uncultured Sulfurovum sp. TaxID=269237 RepID=A0A6S6S794_9BACT|nr:MAG: Aminodeoxychorismate lyase (EC [uncultured Sulfurovum sp.]